MTTTGGTGGQGGMGGQGGNPLTNPGSMGGSGGNGGNAKGGGIAAESPFSLYNTTVAANRSFSSFSGNGGPGGPGNPNGFPGNPGNPGVAEAGGIWAPVNPDATGLLTSVSSVIALNLTTVYVAGTAADSPSDVEATFANATNTLLQYADQQAVGITNGANGDIVGVDPNLGPLQDNGGPTPTMAPLAKQPRDRHRFQPAWPHVRPAWVHAAHRRRRTDIGAFEFGASAPAGGGNGGGGGSGVGGGGAGGSAAAHPIFVKIMRKHGRRLIEVFDQVTGAEKVSISPSGRAFQRNFSVQTRDVNGDGVSDVIVTARLSRKKTLIEVFSGIDGSPLPSRLA